MAPKGLSRLHAELHEAKRDFEEAERIYEMYGRDIEKADPLERPALREVQAAAHNEMLGRHKQVREIEGQIRTQDPTYTRDYFAERASEDRETARDADREAKQARDEHDHSPENHEDRALPASLMTPTAERKAAQTSYAPSAQERRDQARQRGMEPQLSNDRSREQEIER